MSWESLNPLYWYENWKRTQDVRDAENRRNAPVVREVQVRRDEDALPAYRDRTRPTGYDQDTTRGDGGVITCDIDAGDEFLASWVWLGIWRAPIAGLPIPVKIDEAWYLYAADHGDSIGVQPIWGSTGTSARTLVYSNRLPLNQARLLIYNSNVNYDYTLAGIWERDR